MTPDPACRTSTRSPAGDEPCGLRTLPARQTVPGSAWLPDPSWPRPVPTPLVSKLPGAPLAMSRGSPRAWRVRPASQTHPTGEAESVTGARPAQGPQRDSGGSDGNLGAQALLLPQQLDNCTPKDYTSHPLADGHGFLSRLELLQIKLV